MISFIVPAYNEEQLIGATLEALKLAVIDLHLNYELIVVDDASSDETAAVSRNAGARVVRVAYRQIAAARNAGAREAKGDIFIFVDADTVVNADVVNAAVRALRNGAVGGG